MIEHDEKPEWMGYRYGGEGNDITLMFGVKSRKKDLKKSCRHLFIKEAVWR